MSQPIIILMGVSGSGKTTVGQLLSAQTGIPFFDGDDFHPAANVAKMAAGTPLDDDDRWPWLDRVGATLADRAAHPAGVVIACSALRRRYRDRIRTATGSALRFIYLEAEQATMVRRLEARPNHYMPPSLVQSQFATLEPPQPDQEPDVVVVPAAGAVDPKVAAIVETLTGRPG